MKLIVAIIRPFKLTEVVDAVAQHADFPGMTVLEGRGFGREKAMPDLHTPNEELQDFVARTVALVAAPDDQALAVARLIEQVAHTGRAGDGKVFVIPLDAAVRIATGDVGDTALR